MTPAHQAVSGGDHPHHPPDGAPDDQRAASLRVAIFTDTYPPQINGVARTLARLVDAVQARGGAAQVFTVDDPDCGSTPPPAGDIAFAALRYPSRPFWAYDGLRLSWPSRTRVRADVARFGPTIVHAATEFGVGLAGRSCARGLGIPFVSSYHTSFAEYAKYYRLGALSTPGWSYLRWFHNGGLRTYCPTQAIRREVEAHGFERTALWSRGIDSVRFSPGFRSGAMRSTMGADDDHLLVTYVGRLGLEKGLDVALAAVEIVERERPGRLRFAAVGDGPYREQLQQRAPSGSWLPGALHGDALSSAYACSDVFFFPSTTDTFGNVMLEAMASGVPVLGADVGPTREQVLPDRGWLADPRNPSSYAARLIALIDDRAAVRAAGLSALAFARTKTWDAIWDALLADYLRLHKTHGRAGA